MVNPAAAFFGADLGQFVLSHDAVRTADDPDRALLEFLQSTYKAAAVAAEWDRDAVECPTGSPGVLWEAWILRSSQERPLLQPIVSDLDRITHVDETGRRETDQPAQLVKAAFIGANRRERRHDAMLAVSLQIFVKIVPADRSARIQIGFDRQAAGIDHFVRFELDVEVFEHLRGERRRVEPDGATIDEVPRGNQRAIDEQRMILREEDVTVRGAIVDGKLRHTDRQHAGMPGRGPIPLQGLTADPLDRLRTAGRDDVGAYCKMLDGDLTFRRQNLRAAREAANTRRD